jgi:hypothetical protein
MQLTARDRDILQLLGLCRFLTRPQVQDYLYPVEDGSKEHSRKNIVTHRLMLLYQNGYLERLHPAVVAGSGSSPIVYCLDRRGGRLVAAERGIELSEVLCRKRQRERAFLFLQHTLAVNDFRIATMLASRQRGDRIVRWLDERALCQHAAMDGLRQIASSIGKGGGILPDAYFTLQLDGKKACFFLELDRGHTEGRRIRRKVAIYWRYFDSRLYERQFKAKSLRVLTVTTSDQRLANMKRWAEAEGGSELFWFTTQRLVHPTTVLRGPIWSIGGREGLHALA